MYYQVLKHSGKTYTVEIQMDIDILDDGTPSVSPEDDAQMRVFTIMVVQPPIDGASLLDLLFPDLDEWEMDVRTPFSVRYSQFPSLDRREWSLDEFIEYLKEAGVRLVRYVERLDAGELFLHPNWD